MSHTGISGEKSKMEYNVPVKTCDVLAWCEKCREYREMKSAERIPPVPGFIGCGFHYYWGHCKVCGESIGIDVTDTQRKPCVHIDGVLWILQQYPFYIRNYPVRRLARNIALALLRWAYRS